MQEPARSQGVPGANPGRAGNAASAGNAGSAGNGAAGSAARPPHAAPAPHVPGPGRAPDGSADGHPEAPAVAAGILTAPEVGRLLNACSQRAATGLRNRALIAVLYRGGLRVSEAIALVPADVDRSARTLRVGRRRRRPTLALDAGSFAFVESWLRRRRERGLPDDAPLLCTLKGEPLKPSYIRALLPRLARKAGIPKRVSAEALRRTLALELAREGVPVGLIQAHLGHSSPVTTARFLARVTPGGVALAMQHRASWLP